MFLMKPDTVFLNPDNTLAAIVDAKWEILDDREKKLRVSRADLYQMAAYAARRGVHRLALAHPGQRRLQDVIELQLQNSPATLKVAPLDVNTNPEASAPVRRMWTV